MKLFFYCYSFCGSSVWTQGSFFFLFFFLIAKRVQQMCHIVWHRLVEISEAFTEKDISQMYVLCIYIGYLQLIRQNVTGMQTLSFRVYMNYYIYYIYYTVIFKYNFPFSMTQKNLGTFITGHNFKYMDFLLILG